MGVRTADHRLRRRLRPPRRRLREGSGLNHSSTASAAAARQPGGRQAAEGDARRTRRTPEAWKDLGDRLRDAKSDPSALTAPGAVHAAAPEGPDGWTQLATDSASSPDNQTQEARRLQNDAQVAQPSTFGPPPTSPLGRALRKHLPTRSARRPARPRPPRPQDTLAARQQTATAAASAPTPELAKLQPAEPASSSSSRRRPRTPATLPPRSPPTRSSSSSRPTTHRCRRRRPRSRRSSNSWRLVRDRRVRLLAQRRPLFTRTASRGRRRELRFQPGSNAPPRPPLGRARVGSAPHRRLRDRRPADGRTDGHMASSCSSRSAAPATPSQTPAPRERSARTSTTRSPGLASKVSPSRPSAASSTTRSSSRSRTRPGSTSARTASRPR